MGIEDRQQPIPKDLQQAFQEIRQMRKPKATIHIAGNKLYVICPSCQSLVRLNKPLFGSLHVCT